MKKFIINCNFGGQIGPLTVCIGEPEANHHPLHFQAEWLSKEKGGTIPPEVMQAIEQLASLAKKNEVKLEQLCVYALGVGQQETDSSINEGGEVDNEEEPAEEISDD